MYFSPLSVTDGKQRERNHPSLSSYSAGRVMVLFKISMLGGRGIVIVYLVNIVMYVDSSLDFLWMCCGYWARRPSNLEAFCKRPRGGRLTEKLRFP